MKRVFLQRHHQTMSEQNKIDHIYRYYDSDLSAYRKELYDLLRTDIWVLDNILKYVFRRGGKEIRPLLVIMSASMVGHPTVDTYRAAALIEVLHNATLLHDDVVDQAEQRRGMFTVNKIWKNKFAVLTGDFLLATGLSMALQYGYYQLLHLVSDATKRMSEGELWQMQHSREFKLTEEEYYQIIEAKTAVLFALCCMAGAYTTGADEREQNLLYKLGLSIGMVFQMADDVMDFLSSQSGKSKFADLREKKLTLPVIYALSQSTPDEKLYVLQLIKELEKQKNVENQILSWLYAKNSFDYVQQRMHHFAEQAKTYLSEFQNAEVQKHFLDLINFCLTRNK